MQEPSQLVERGHISGAQPLAQMLLNGGGRHEESLLIFFTTESSPTVVGNFFSPSFTQIFVILIFMVFIVYPLQR